MAATTSTWQSPPSQSEFSGILKERETFGTGRGDDTADQINSWFDDLMLQSGLGLSPSMLLAICLCSGVALGGLVFVIQENLLTTAPLLRALVLGGPPLALIALLWPRFGRSRPRILVYTALTVAVMAATLSITVLGDGLADTPKQGHLIINAALAWWICLLTLGVGAFAARRR